MSSVGDLLLVVCDIYTICMYVSHLIWDNERVFERTGIGDDLLLECIQQTEIWREKCNGVGMYFL